MKRLSGYRALNWEHWLRSHAWKATSAPQTAPPSLVAGSASLATIARRTLPIRSKRPQGRLLAKEEAPLLEVYASLERLHHGLVKSAALPVQREVRVSATGPMCLAFAGRAHIDPRPTQCNANLVRSEHIHLQVV